MAATTKEITDRLINLMTTTHLSELNKLVKQKQIEQSLATDMNFAYSEGAKHMLDHLTKMGIVEYVEPEPSNEPR